MSSCWVFGSLYLLFRSILDADCLTQNITILSNLVSLENSDKLPSLPPSSPSPVLLAMAVWPVFPVGWAQPLRQMLLLLLGVSHTPLSSYLPSNKGEQKSEH